MVPVEEADEADEESSVSGDGGMLAALSSSPSYSGSDDSSRWADDGMGGWSGRFRSFARRNSFCRSLMLWAALWGECWVGR